MKAVHFDAACVVALSVLVGYSHGPSVSLSQQVSILANLSAVGAVIFGIVGAWVAILYPRTYEQSLDDELPNEIAEGRVAFFLKCLAPMKISCAIFIVSLFSLPAVAGFVVPEPSNGVQESSFVRQCFFGVCILLTALQVYAMIQSLLPMLDSKDSLLETISRRKRGEAASGAPKPAAAVYPQLLPESDSSDGS